MEPAKAEPPPPDPIAQKMAALAKEPPPPEPAPGPTPEEKKQIEEKLEQERVTAEQRQKQEELKKKQEADAKKRADDEKKRKDDLKKKEDERKRKLAEDAKKKQQQFDPDKIAAELNKVKDGGAPAAAAKPETPTKAKGPVGGDKDGRDTRLTASQEALLDQAVRDGVSPCWRVLSGGQGADATVVRLRVQLNADGTVRGEPQVLQGQSTPYFAAAADTAKRAVMQCQPFNLPSQWYSIWASMVWRFDPKDMY